MTTAGLVLIYGGLVIFLPLVFIYLSVRFGRMGPHAEARVKLAGATISDLRRAADEKLVKRFMPLTFRIAVGMVLIGSLLLWLA